MAAERAPMAKLDLNKATKDELTALPGVGPAAADAIVKYRDQHGGFRRLDELAEVPGVGAQLLAGLRGRVSLAAKGNGAAKSDKKAAEGDRRPAEQGAQQAASAADEVAKTAQETAARGAETAEEAGQTGAEASGAAAGGAREALRTAGEAGARGAEQAAASAGDDAEAVAASADSVLAGLQDIHREWLAYVQEQMQDTVDTGRALAACRSPQELIELQTRYTRSSWSRFASESTKMANLTMRVMGAGMQPLQARARDAAARTASGREQAR